MNNHKGKYTIIMNGKRIPLNVVDEILLPKGVPHGGEAEPNTRTIHAFGGRRAERVK